MTPSTDTDHEITQTEPEAHSMSKRKACLLLALSFALLVVGITAEAWVVGLLITYDCEAAEDIVFFAADTVCVSSVLASQCLLTVLLESRTGRDAIAGFVEGFKFKGDSKHGLAIAADFAFAVVPPFALALIAKAIFLQPLFEPYSDSIMFVLSRGLMLWVIAVLVFHALCRATLRWRIGQLFGLFVAIDLGIIALGLGFGFAWALHPRCGFRLEDGMAYPVEGFDMGGLLLAFGILAAGVTGIGALIAKLRY